MESKTSTKIHLLALAFTLLLFIAASTNTTTAAATTTNSTYKKYLKTACNCTRYPKLCYNSLSFYASIIKTNDLTLCTTALNVTLQFATNTSSLIYALLNQKRLSNVEIEVIKDCIYEIDDSIDEISQSLKVLSSLNLSSPDVRFQISNVKTWISAAITDEDTCTDDFDGAVVRSSVQRKLKKLILNVASMTSNALALINNKLNI